MTSTKSGTIKYVRHLTCSMSIVHKKVPINSNKSCGRKRINSESLDPHSKNRETIAQSSSPATRHRWANSRSARTCCADHSMFLTVEAWESRPISFGNRDTRGARFNTSQVILKVLNFSPCTVDSLSLDFQRDQENRLTENVRDRERKIA